MEVCDLFYKENICSPDNPKERSAASHNDDLILEFDIMKEFNFYFPHNNSGNVIKMMKSKN